MMNHEIELLTPVNLCDSRGRLNPAAIGWSRAPLHRCHIPDHWPRKKRWHYWNITGPDHLFSVTLADVDYLTLAVVYALEYSSKRLFQDVIALPAGGRIEMQDTVHGPVRLRTRRAQVEISHSPEGARIAVDWRTFRGLKVDARLDVEHPPGHETLNVVVPWSSTRFQFTSKQCCLPTSGSVRIGGRVLEFDPADSFACLDFGRGVWAYRTTWNWASFSSVQSSGLLGINLGGQWTDGTGMTENGTFRDGRMDKISEPVDFVYDRRDWMRPWHLRSRIGDNIDLRFTPFFNLSSGLNLGLLRSRANQLFGRFTGTIEHHGERLPVAEAIGWAEEHVARW